MGSLSIRWPGKIQSLMKAWCRDGLLSKLHPHEVWLGAEDMCLVTVYEAIGSTPSPIRQSEPGKVRDHGLMRLASIDRLARANSWKGLPSKKLVGSNGFTSTLHFAFFVASATEG